MSGRLLSLQAVRGGYGLAQLAAPGAIDAVLPPGLGRLGRGLDRVLGARQLVQAGLTALHPTAGAVRVGVAVDGLHAASMLALALSDRRRRASAGLDTAIAAGFALAGVWVVRRR